MRCEDHAPRGSAHYVLVEMLGSHPEADTERFEAVLAATLASPQFANNDYGSTPAATAAGAFPNTPALIRGAGGALSQGDAGNQLQLEDATMRAQFNKTGASNYHVILHANVLPAVTIKVPSNQGTLLRSGRGVVFADINISWVGRKDPESHDERRSGAPAHLPDGQMCCCTWVRTSATAV